MQTVLLLSLATFAGALPGQLSSRDFLRMVVATGGEVVIDQPGRPWPFIDDEADFPKKGPFSIIRVDTTNSTLDDLGAIVSLPPIGELAMSARQLTSANARAFRALRKLPNLVVEGKERELMAIDPGPPIQGLESVRVLSATIGPGVVSLLANTHTLDDLSFHQCRYRTGVLAELRGAKQLRSLGIDGATDADLNDLPPLPSLEALSTGGGGKIGSGLAALGRQPALEVISLRSRDIEPGQLRHLGKVARLAGLYLDESTITDDAAPVIATLHGIRVLSLQSTRITDKTVRALASLPQLERLTLNSTAVSDDSIKALKKFPALVSLELSSTKVRAQGLESMEEFKNLEQLNVYLDAGEFDDERAAALARMPKIQSLTLGPTHLTAAGIRSLGSIATLNSLRLFGQRTTTPMLSELCKLAQLEQLAICPPEKDADRATFERALRSSLPKCQITIWP